MTTQADRSISFSVPEASYATITTTTRSFEFTDESVDWDPTFVQGQGLRVGSRLNRAARRSATPAKQQVTGDITVECCSKGLGFLLQAALGTVTTTQRATTGVYQQNHTPTTTDYLNSYTMQIGDPPLGGGAATAYTIPGSVCSGFELDCQNAATATLKTTWNGNSINTATAYAAPSYPTPMELFEFQEGAITIGGSVTAPTTTALATGGTAVASIRDFNLKWDNKLDDGGFTFGASGKRARKPAVGAGDGMLTGTITAEYVDNTLRDAILNQSGLSIVLTFIGSTNIGSGSDHPDLQVWLPLVQFEDGVFPHAKAGEVLTQSINFTGLDNLTNPPLTVVYASTDTAP